MKKAASNFHAAPPWLNAIRKWVAPPRTAMREATNKAVANLAPKWLSMANEAVETEVASGAVTAVGIVETEAVVAGIVVAAEVIAVRVVAVNP